MLEFVKHMDAGSWGQWTLVVILITALIRMWPRYTEIKAGSDQALRSDMMTLIKGLQEHSLEAEVRCAERIAVLEADNERLHGQLHEVREQLASVMAERTLIERQGVRSRRASPVVAKAQETVNAADQCLAEAKAEDGA